MTDDELVQSMPTGAQLRVKALDNLDVMDILDTWSKPGFYWFVMPPKPGKTGPYTLFMSTGKAFESEETDPLKAHAECRKKAAQYTKDTLNRVNADRPAVLALQELKSKTDDT